MMTVWLLSGFLAFYDRLLVITPHSKKGSNPCKCFAMLCVDVIRIMEADYTIPQCQMTVVLIETRQILANAQNKFPVVAVVNFCKCFGNGDGVKGLEVFFNILLFLHCNKKTIAKPCNNPPRKKMSKKVNKKKQPPIYGRALAIVLFELYVMLLCFNVSMLM